MERRLDRAWQFSIASLKATFFLNPGVANRTFGNRTQSNPIARLGSIGFGNRTQWNSQKKICQSNAIERTVIEQFNNRTSSNSIEHNRTPRQSENTNQFHPVWNKAFQSNKLFIGFYFKHECNRQDVGQGRGETYHSGSGGKGLPRVLFRRPCQGINLLSSRKEEIGALLWGSFCSGCFVVI